MDVTRNMIKLIQARPALWDKGCLDYRDRNMRESAWLEVYRRLEPEYDNLDSATQSHISQQITKKWYNIRDAYVKYLKNDKYNPSSSRFRRRPYIYHEILKFLDPAVGFQNAEDANDSAQMATEESDTCDDSSRLLNSVFVDIDEESIETSACSSKKTKQETKPDEAVVEQSLVGVLASFIQREENEDVAFFKSILPSVGRLSEDSKFEFRIRVMKLLKDLKKKDEEGTSKLKCEYLDEEFM